jgi:hypothetical protein
MWQGTLRQVLAAVDKAEIFSPQLLKVKAALRLGSTV